MSCGIKWCNRVSEMTYLGVELCAKHEGELWDQPTAQDRLAWLRENAPKNLIHTH